mmetsp:Transcript_62248/g.76252  ORF Transcript_62248/g.76252 Transcript_62248/m.76252 type:complete len:454 (+) Transcript_62248:112-1473(+)
MLPNLRDRKKRILSPLRSKIIDNTNIIDINKKRKLRMSDKMERNDDVNKHQKIQILLIFLVGFTIFLMISLLSPNTFGIDPSFTETYYQEKTPIIYVFIYDILINKHCLKNLLKNDYEGIKTYPVRIHYMKRGWNYDTRFDYNDIDTIEDDGNYDSQGSNDNDGIKSNENGTDNSQENMNSDDKERERENTKMVDEMILDFNNNDNNNNDNRNIYTSLGCQFVNNSNSKVNGLLIEIDKDILTLFDEYKSSFRKVKIPINWIDFIYDTPTEFTEYMQIQEINLMQGNNASTTNKFVDNNVIENANSMIKNHPDLPINNETIKQNSIKNKLHSDDLIIFDKSTEKKKNPTKVIITNRDILVHTYVVPKEIMLKDDLAQDKRILKSSYIDLCLSGCMDIGGSQFAREFILNTHGWTPFSKYDDDRMNSYFNEFNTISDDEITKIDQLLHDYAFNI